MLNWGFSCHQASRIASRAMEEPLGSLEKRVLSLHLMMCTGCINFSKRLQFLRRASEKVPDALEREEI